MPRVFGLALALVASLVMLVPSVAGATPWGADEHVIVSTAGPFTLPAGQDVDLLVIVSGDATVAGHAGGIVVVNGKVTLVGTQTADLLAIRSHVVVDSASSITGDVSVLDSTIDAAPSAIGGSMTDLGPQLAGAWIFGDVARVLLFVGFLLAALCTALALAALASRQVRQAGASIGREPLAVIAAALLGLIGIITVGVLAIVTIIGVPTGLAILGFAMPALLIGGYAVAAIWLGEQVLARTNAGVDRARPYFAAVVGVALLGALSVIPIVGGLFVLAGFGALVLFLWRTARGTASSNQAQAATAASPA